MVLLFCFRSGKYILELSGVAPLLIIIIGQLSVASYRLTSRYLPELFNTKAG